jgi:hypothetical protein
MRLEGWRQCLDSRRSFETRARSAPSRDNDKAVGRGLGLRDAAQRSSPDRRGFSRPVAIARTSRRYCSKVRTAVTLESVRIMRPSVPYHPFDLRGSWSRCSSHPRYMCRSNFRVGWRPCRAAPSACRGIFPCRQSRRRHSASCPGAQVQHRADGRDTPGRDGGVAAAASP